MPMFSEEEFLNRTITTGKNYAYLKIGEGCSNKCTYCAIPYIRGRYRSEKMEDLLLEARKLSDDGVKELILVAQDVTNYGKDLSKDKKPMLIELLDALCKLDFERIVIPAFFSFLTKVYISSFV